ncbi:MAG: hypothetical protein AB8E15_07595 [Bdellovibrionales bacterium]
MFFGDFLIQYKIVSQEQVLTALEEQLLQTKPLLTILRQNTGIESGLLLEIIKKQVDEQKDLRTILIEHSYMDKEDVDKLIEIQSSDRMPLGQILIVQGVLSVESITFALDAYKLLQMDIVDDLKGDFNELLSKVVPANDLNLSVDSSVIEIGGSDSNGAPPVEEVSLSEDKLELELKNFEFHELLSFVVSELLDQFDLERREQFLVLIRQWDQLFVFDSHEFILDNIKTLFHELHTLKGTSKVLRANIMVYTLEVQENLIGSMQTHIQNLSPNIINELQHVFVDLVGIQWDIRESIFSCSSEEGFWIDENKKRLEEIVTKYKNLMDKMKKCSESSLNGKAENIS